MLLAYNALSRLGQAYVFTGHSVGFTTLLQTWAGMQDSFVFNYLFDKPATYGCIYEAELNANSINALFLQYSNSGQVYTVTTGITQFNAPSGALTQLNNYFACYSSPYSGSFALLDTLRIPRPCAARSGNLTQLDYFYGQNAKTQTMKDQNLDKIVSMMDKEKEYVFQNGSVCSAFTWLGVQGSSDWTNIYVQTNDESLVGTQRMMVRGCDILQNLLELNFYVNVTSNSAPEFDTDI